MKPVFRFALYFIILFVFPHSDIYAATNWGSCLYDGEVATIQCLVPLFRNIVTAVVQLTGVALFFVFIIAGYNFLTSGGNPKQLEKAKSTLTYAIIGIIIVVSAYLILRIIESFTGVTVTKFEIPK